MNNLPPEIILKILDYADSERSSLLRINSHWFQCGISVVWRDVRCERLAKIAKNRQQIYASVIRSFYANGYKVNAFRHLAFPKLTQLQLIFSFQWRSRFEPLKIVESNLKPLLPSGLHTISLSGYFDPDLLVYVRLQCPQLRGLQISCPNPPSPHLTPEFVLKFLRSSPTLSEISLGIMITGDIFDHLAERGNLREFFCTKQIVDTYILEKLNTSSPFPVLRKLKISVMEDAFPSLTDAVQSVRELDLTLVHDDDTNVQANNVLRDVFKLAGLRELILTIHYNPMCSTVIDNEELMSLRSLSHLVMLNISASWGSFLRAPCFTDRDFAQLFTNLAHLQHLHLNISMPKRTTVSLVALGKCCPSLRTLRLTDALDMMVLQSEKVPLLPKLEKLTIDTFTNTESRIRFVRKYSLACSLFDFSCLRSPHQHAFQIQRSFPKLKWLEAIMILDSMDPRLDFSARIVDIWKSLN
ncbi:hypothetical protein BDV23DRAFT_186769 [Aspergillus alliaceus]|uniref:F-box domain-containing protein n=1 Tax=Petromyces alliaceus TaxID=209559 RepID=A0A5N7BYY6_PETAA|nr:hypothetical protein BDV23DRAFT_186769 [Aspergillus alliaceus]